jgi:hypothetical protein
MGLRRLFRPLPSSMFRLSPSSGLPLVSGTFPSSSLSPFSGLPLSSVFPGLDPGIQAAPEGAGRPVGPRVKPEEDGVGVGWKVSELGWGGFVSLPSPTFRRHPGGGRDPVFHDVADAKLDSGVRRNDDGEGSVVAVEGP